MMAGREIIVRPAFPEEEFGRTVRRRIVGHKRLTAGVYFAAIGAATAAATSSMMR
jgi:hypothetical protein